MAEPLNPDEAARQFAGALMQMGELFGQVLEATKGYRAKCIEQGFAAPSAEEMSVHYHKLIISVLESTILAQQRR